MKTTSLLLASLLCVLGANASAQVIEGEIRYSSEPAVAPVPHEVRAAHHAIHRSRREIAEEKRNLEHDKNVARLEAGDVREVERRQDELAARGDYRGAQKLERTRYHEANEAKIARRQVSHDRNVIAIKRRQIEHNERVIDNARGER